MKYYFYKPATQTIYYHPHSLYLLLLLGLRAEIFNHLLAYESALVLKPNTFSGIFRSCLNVSLILDWQRGFIFLLFKYLDIKFHFNSLSRTVKPQITASLQPTI